MALVAEVDFLLLRLVREREARDKGTGRLGLDVEQEVAFGIVAYLFLSCVVVRVKGVHEQHFVTNLLVTRHTKVKINLPVVLPYFSLFVRLLQLIWFLIGTFRLILLVFCCGGRSSCNRLLIWRATKSSFTIYLHLDLGLPINAIDHDVVELEVAMNHLDLLMLLL